MPNTPNNNLVPGQPFPHSAKFWNPVIEASRSIRDSANPSPSSNPGALAASRAIVVLVKNTTGSAVGRNCPLKINGVVISPTDNELSFRDSPIFVGIAPTDDSTNKLLLTIEPIAIDGIGKSIVSGAAIATIDMTNVSHTHAKPASANVTHLVSAEDGFPILYVESSAGQSLGVVLLGSGCCCTADSGSTSDSGDGSGSDGCGVTITESRITLEGDCALLQTRSVEIVNIAGCLYQTPTDWSVGIALATCDALAACCGTGSSGSGSGPTGGTPTVTTPCCPDGVPETLTATFTGGPLAGQSATLIYDAIDSFWRGSPPSGASVDLSCGGTSISDFYCQVDFDATAPTVPPSTCSPFFLSVDDGVNQYTVS